MKYFANAVISHFAKKIKKLQKGDSAGHRMLVMIPAMPETDLLSVIDALASYCLADSSVVLTLKIAKVLTDDWMPQWRKKAEDMGWVDDRGNLTYYRNLPPVSGKLSLVVLCGADRVTDSAGLADFHTCDLDTIWQSEMGTSFQGWVKTKLQSIGINRVAVEDLKTFDRLLKPILEYGRGDLLQIGDWMENLDLNHAGEVLEVQKTMLTRLDYFGLPSFIGFPLRQKKKTLAFYIDKAGSFFNYTLLLEAREREKCVKAIDKIIDSIRGGEDPGFSLEEDEVRGAYSCGEDFLEGLRNYILTEDKEDRQKLLKCDFVTILDKILKYRKKEKKEKKEGLRKISGSPVEMILTAVWLSMRDFYRDKLVDPEAQITEISIKYDLFKHEEVDEEDVESASDSTELAREYLSRLIGGLDNIVNQHLSLSNFDGQEIAVKCLLVGEDIQCKHSRTAEPQLEFSVKISYGYGNDVFSRKFAWRLPENHSYRLAMGLLNRANDAMVNNQEIWKLPVYHLPYYDELLRASNDDEIRNVLLHCVRDEDRSGQRFSTNLLSEDWLATGESLIDKLKYLADKYSRFIMVSAQEGLFSGLFSGNGRRTEWADFNLAYKEALDAASNDPTQISAGMLLRSFLVILSREFATGSTWHADPFEKSGIITVLHPALLEMLEAQVLYLFACFNYAANKNIGSNSRREAFKPHIWRTYVDLSEIQAPLSGLLYNEEQNLDTSIRGQGLIHRIGSPASADATLSTRLLLNYSDSPDDDEVFSDSEMFRETSESKHLLRLMLDYFRLHPHARDGLSLAVFRNKDIQPIIAAVHQYLIILADPKEPRSYVLSPDRRRPYAISVTFFTESSDDADVSRWIAQWQERWEAAETESKYQPYNVCRFSVAHRLVENGGQASFQRLINDNFEADIAVFYDFIGAGSGVNRFENVPPFDITTRTLKFPILEKACCTIRNPAEQYKRARVISNRQFLLGAQHSNLMHCLKNKSQQTGSIVVGTGDFTPWRNVIDALHAKTEWVICIDPSMDERLIKKSAIGSGFEREIIGFGSGVGTHGEDNYTISTEQFSLSDVRARLCASIGSLYAGIGWSANECQDVASGVLAEARGLSGLSLVRATGVDDNYIRDFMAYALSRKMLRVEESVLCDNMISLDAYRHWFDLADNPSRPDLMWLIAKIGTDKRLHLDIRLIECKMGQQSQELLVKARSQVNNGLRVLMPAFAPLTVGKGSFIEDLRPDRRYWWMQLHRLIASKAEIDKGQNADVMSALERLAEGDYEITWNAAVFAFWINSSEANIQRIGQWTTGASNDLKANIYVMGSQFVNHLAKSTKEFSLDWSEMENQADKVAGNICDDIPDIESPLGEDEDDDITKWSEEESNSEEENESTSDFEYNDEVNTSCDDPDFENDGSIKPYAKKDSEETQPNNLTELTPTEASTSATPEKIQDSSSPEGLYLPVESSSNVTERLLLGASIGNDNPIYWEFGHSDLSNRHMLIFGASGMGKTYAIQCLLCEMALAHQHSLIVDYTNGFLPNHLEPLTNSTLKPKQHVIRNSPLPINPFLPQTSDNGGIIIEENSNSIAKRIAGIFNAVYQIGDQQFSVLHRAIMVGVDDYKSNMSFDVLLEILEDFMEDKKLKSPALTLHSKLRPFVLDTPFSHGQDGLDWDSFFSGEINLCNIFQLAGLDMHSSRLVTEFVLWDLYGYLQAKGKRTDPKVIVLDEVQNLDHQDGSPLSKYLREGRKFGISLILATQTMSNMKKDEKDRMFNAGHKLFFKPADTELKAFAEIAAVATRQRPDEWVNKLANLKKGECYSIGQILNQITGKLLFQPQKIKITSLEERGFNGKED